MTQTRHAKATASEDPVPADVLPDNDILVVEGTFAQDSADDISMKDMADTHDSYHAVLASTGDHVSPTKIGN